MIYNVVYYAIAQTGLAIKANGVPSDHKGDVNLMVGRGGPVAPLTKRNDYAVQLIVKNNDQVVANQIADAIYLVFLNIYNFKLPAVTVKSVIYPEVTVAQVSPNQSPAYIGTDENGLHMFSCNFRFIV